MCYNDGCSVSFLRTELQPPRGCGEGWGPAVRPQRLLRTVSMPVAPICVEAGQRPRETVRGAAKAATPAGLPVLVLWAQPCSWSGCLDSGSHEGHGRASPVPRYPALPFLLLEIPSELGKGWESPSESGGSVCGAWALGQVGGTSAVQRCFKPPSLSHCCHL